MKMASGEYNSQPLSMNNRFKPFSTCQKLVDFYKQKISDLETEINSIIGRFKTQQKTLDYQHELEIKTKKQAEELLKLREALSDMQLFLFQEREHVLRLYAENDHLKIKVLEDRHKIFNLLKNNCKKCLHQQKGYADHDDVNEVHGEESAELEKEQENNLLRMKLQSIEEQRKEQLKLASDKINKLIHDRKACQDELKTEHTCSSNKIFSLNQRLEEMQQMLLQSTEECFELKSNFSIEKETWIKEKIEYLLTIDQLKCASTDASKKNYGFLKQASGKNEQLLMKQTEKYQKDLKMFKDKWTLAEEKLRHFRAEKNSHETTLQMQVKKLRQSLENANKRYSQLERRRNLESEGYKTDIVAMKADLKTLERQIHKLAIDGGENDDAHLIFKSLHNNEMKFNKLGGRLVDLRSQLYRLENDMFVQS